MRTIIFQITFILSLFEETLYGYLLQQNLSSKERRGVSPSSFLLNALYERP